MSDGLRVAFVVVLIVCGVVWWNEHQTRQSTQSVALAPRVDTIVQSIPEVRTVVRRQVIYQHDTTFIPQPVPASLADDVVVRPDTMVFGVYVTAQDTIPTLTHPAIVALFNRTAAARDTLAQAFAQLDTAFVGVQQAREQERTQARVAVRSATNRGRWQGLALGAVTALAFAWVAK